MIRRTVESGRRAAEKIMSATVEVRRYTGETTIDPDSLKAVRAHSVVYKGKAKIAAYEAFESKPDIAGAVVTVTRLRADFPVGAFKAQPGDEIHVIGDKIDPNLAGKVVRIAVPSPYKSHATAYRVAVEEVAHG